jgi:putative hydrolase of the HAD superfamily
MIDLVLVDFDDTLVDTGPRFQRARRSLVALMVEQGFSDEDARDMLYNRIDPAMRVTYGLGPRRMEPTFVATYHALCERAGIAPREDVMVAAAELGRGCYGAAPIFEGALDALRRLAAVHRTVIYTQSGDAEYQLSCVRESGIIDVVTEEHVHVCGRKDVDMFAATLRRYSVIDPKAAWMIGNSVRSDINPALQAGANAILVEAADPWEYDLVEPLSTSFHRVPSFPHAVDFLTL